MLCIGIFSNTLADAFYHLPSPCLSISSATKENEDRDEEKDEEKEKDKEMKQDKKKEEDKDMDRVKGVYLDEWSLRS